MAKLKFAKQKDKKQSELSAGEWRILIVDDEPEVHSMTKTVLSNFVLDGKKLKFYSAYSAKEAFEILQTTPDIALILLDVVMESDDAGLILVSKIREKLDNQMVRIVLRTGQPGSAPEEDVIIKYKINDYKEKTELTSKKLFSTIVTAIRSYQDLLTISKNKEGLEKIIDATKSIMEEKSLELFAQGVLIQLISILNLHNDSLILNKNDAISIEKVESGYKILASTGKFENHKTYEDLDEEVKNYIEKATEDGRTHFFDDKYVGHFEFNSKIKYLVYISGCSNINEIDKHLTEIFSNNIAIAFNNLSLNKEIQHTQKEIIETLGEVVEKRADDTSQHVHRVAEFSYMLAKDYGLDEKEAQLIRMASPMHDVGKIGIPDSILLKKGKLTDEEFEIMKTHSDIGHEILKKSDREILKAAAIIAEEHHEKYNGTGYPLGLEKDNIHIYGRITAVADVFDALYHERCYKPAWPLEDILKLLEEEKGRHFDPELVDIVLGDVDKYVKIIQID